MKILIAEDDLTSRKFLLGLLAQYGQCDTVVDGLEALEAIMLSEKENEPYDLICLDIMMPKVDGVRVLKAIRDYEKQKGTAEQNHINVIMTTALADTHFANQALSLGCEAYISKPIDPDELIETVEKVGLIS